MTNKKLKIKLMHSTCGRIPRHIKTVRGLGFRKLYEEKLVLDTPAIRGMIKEVSYLVKVVE